MLKRGQFPLSAAAGGYAGLFLLQAYDVSPIVAALGAMAAGFAVGLLVECGVYAPLRRRNASSLAAFLGSLAVLVIVQNAIAVAFGSDVLVARSRFGADPVSLLGGQLTLWQLISVMVAAMAFLVTFAVLRFTKVGRISRAVGDDPYLARVAGLGLQGALLQVTIYAAVLGGLCGFLVAYDRTITPSSSLNLILLAITAAVVGGIGSVPGALVGGLTVGLTRHLAGWFLPSQWQDVIAFALLLGVLLLRPQGVFGTSLRRAAV